jgi:predicted outer membrane protein
VLRPWKLRCVVIGDVLPLALALALAVAVATKAGEQPGPTYFNEILRVDGMSLEVEVEDIAIGESVQSARASSFGRRTMSDPWR